MSDIPTMDEIRAHYAESMAFVMGSDDHELGKDAFDRALAADRKATAERAAVEALRAAADWVRVAPSANTPDMIAAWLEDRADRTRVADDGSVSLVPVVDWIRQQQAGGG